MNCKYFIPDRVLLLLNTGRINSKCFLGCPFPSKLKITIMAMKTHSELESASPLALVKLVKKAAVDCEKGHLVSQAKAKWLLLQEWHAGHRPHLFSMVTWALSRQLQAVASLSWGTVGQSSVLSRLHIMLAWEEDTGKNVDLLLIIGFPGEKGG